MKKSFVNSKGGVIGTKMMRKLIGVQSFTSFIFFYVGYLPNLLLSNVQVLVGLESVPAADFTRRFCK